MSVQLEWNDDGLKKIFDSLSSDMQHTFHKKALRSTANKLAKMVKTQASSSGLSRTGPAEKNGWRWVRFGRVASSISTGKLWKKGTRQTIRVFNRGGRTLSFSKSAPHAHLVILGHKLYIPRRDGSVHFVRKTKGVPIYQAAYSQADVLFEREIERSVALMVKRLNRQGKL